MCNIKQSAMSQAPTQKFGYLDIKQSSKVRPRKLKSWRRQWAVLTKLSNLSSDEYVAKLDLYDNETKWRNNSSDKITLVLENVTCIQSTTSRTHKHAFQVIERHPVLVMSGATELESYSWILTLQQIFTPEQIGVTEECYSVTLIENTHSIKWNMLEELTLSVSPTCINLGDLNGACLISWGLHTLMRFSVENHPVTGEKTVLVIESGQNAPTGHCCFHFLSDNAQDIMNAIKRSICLALEQKQQAKGMVSFQQRQLSSTVSEKNSQSLFDSHPVFSSVLRNRSNSGSSKSTINVTSSNVGRELSSSSVSMGSVNADVGLLIHTEDNTEVTDLQQDVRTPKTHELVTKEILREQSRTRSSSYPIRFSKVNYGYSEIKDMTREELNGSKGKPFILEKSEYNFDRLRSVSAVVASIKARSDQKPGRSVSFETNDDDKSDLDSAISSMSLTPTNDEFPWRDMLNCQDFDTAKSVDPYLSDKKKSNSTPDLQAYWRKHNEVIRFENVYEELDELRASMKSGSKKQDSNIPPALPARPLSLHLTSVVDCKAKMGLKKKRSIFKRHGKSSSETKVRATSLCFCESKKGERAHYGTDCAHFIVSGGERIIQRSKSHLIKTSSSEELIGSSCFSSNDIKDAVVPEVILVKRRRSSDITPVASSFCLDACTTDGWPRFKENLINRREGKNYSEVGATFESISKPVKNDLGNPLISFFLDDANFESNPMVTGKLSTVSTFPSSNIDLLTHDDLPSSVPQVPLLPSALTSQTMTCHKLNPQNYADSPFRSASQFNNFDFWNVEAVPYQQGNINRDMSAPLSFSASLSPDLFLWNQKRVQGMSPQTRSTHVIDSNYMTMLMKSDNLCTDSKSHQAAQSRAFITDKSDNLALPGKHIKDLYIRPTVNTALGVWSGLHYN